MTLVVARVTPLGVRVAADMRITRHGRGGGFVRAALKPILINATLCIAYAGDVDDAIAGVRAAADPGGEIAAAEEHILEAHLRSQTKYGEDNPAEFLVASLNPARLTVVKDGTAKESSAGWLGDHAAFAEYQRHYHAAWAPPPGMFEGLPDAADRDADIEVASRMGTGMHAVVDGPSLEFDEHGQVTQVLIPRGGTHPTVGEAIVTAAPLVPDNLFGYLTYVSAFAPPFAENPNPSVGGVTPADFGTRERGSFTSNLLIPAERGVGAMGLYFLEGRLGVLYAPLLLDDPEVYPDKSRSEFVKAVNRKRGIALEGLGAD